MKKPALVESVELETTADLLWMLFSVLTLDVETQLAVMGGVPPADQAARTRLSENGAELLLYAIQDHEVAWLDEFDDCPVARQFLDKVGEMNADQTLEAFTASPEWAELRELARLTLEEAGLDPHPVPYRIDFNDYVEIVDWEDMQPCLAKQDELAPPAGRRSRQRQKKART